MPEADASNAIATFFLVLVGIWGILETGHSLELSERAWVGQAGGVVYPITVGQPIRYAIQLVNPGKEPAIDLAYVTDTGSIPAPANGDSSNVTVRENVTCAGAQPVQGGGVILPNGSLQRTTDSARGEHPVAVDNTFVQGQTLIYAQGCVTYKTFNRTHHTAYCVVFQAQQQPAIVATTPSVPTAGGSGNAKSGSRTPTSAPSLPTVAVPPAIAVSVINCPTGNSSD